MVEVGAACGQVGVRRLRRAQPVHGLSPRCRGAASSTEQGGCYYGALPACACENSAAAPRNSPWLKVGEMLRVRRAGGQARQRSPWCEDTAAALQ